MSDSLKTLLNAVTQSIRSYVDPLYKSLTSRVDKLPTFKDIPKVPDWALDRHKPVYTPVEIGAISRLNTPVFFIKDEIIFNSLNLKVSVSDEDYAYFSLKDGVILVMKLSAPTFSVGMEELTLNVNYKGKRTVYDAGGMPVKPLWGVPWLSGDGGSGLLILQYRSAGSGGWYILTGNRASAANYGMVKFEDTWENADAINGSIPSVRAINWKLEEKVTVPEIATVGQTIVVSEVDDSGKPTAWEAKDLPSGGGGASEWKTAMEYTAITEDIGTLTVDVPNATEIEVYIFGYAQNADSSATSGSTSFDVKVNNGTIGRFDMYVRTDSKSFGRYIKAEVVDSDVYMIKSENSSSSFATFGNLMQNDRRSVALPVNTISFVPTTSGMLIKAGAKIGIRYR